MKEIKQKKKKSRILAILKWISLGLFAFLFFISISLITINNVQFLRKPVLNNVLKIVNSFLIAKIEIEDLKFKSHNRLWIRNFKMITAGDTLAQFSQLDVKISLSALLNNKIIVRYLKINKPSIKLLRNSKDFKWNFEKIAPPSSPSESTGKGPLVKIQYLELIDAKFRLKDSNYKMDSVSFNPLDIALEGLYIKFDAELDLEAKKFAANFDRITFSELNTQFKVDSLKFTAILDTNSIQVSKFELNTPESKLKINAKIQNYSPLSKYLHTKFDSAIFNITAEAEDFNTSTLKKFVNVPFRDNVTSDFALEATGTTKNLQFDKLNLSMLNSNIHSKGKLKNFTSGKFIYDFVFNNSNIRENDIKSLLNFDLNSIPAFNNAQIKSLKAIGSVDQVSAEYDITSDMGDIKGNSRIKYSPDNTYEGNVHFNQVNLAQILHDHEYSSNFTGDAIFEGSGFNPSKMNSKLYLNLTNSQFLDRSVSNLETDILMEGGIVKVNKFLAEFDDPNVILASPNIRSSKLDIIGEMNIKEMKRPKYSFEINTTGLNLAKLFQNKEFPISVSSKIQIKGDGFNPDLIQLKINSHFDEISFTKLSFLPIDVSLDVQSKDSSEKDIVLKFGEDFIKVKGKIETSKFLNSINGWINYAILFFDSRYEQFINKKFDQEKEDKLNKLAKEITIPPVDVDISLKFGNLSILNNFIPNLGLMSSLETNSRIITGPDNILLDLTDLRIGNTTLNSKGLELNTDAFNFSGVMEILKKDSTIHLSYFDISLDSLDELNINGLAIRNPVADVFIADSNYIVDLNAQFDTLASAALGLKGAFHRENILINFEKLKLNYLDNISLTNKKVGTLQIDNKSFTIKDFEIIGKKSEEIALSGYADTNSFENFVIDFSNIHFTNFKYLFPLGIQDLVNDVDLHLKEAKLEVGGKFSAPTYHFTLNVDEITSKNKQLGFLLADLNYSDLNLNGKVELLNKNDGILPSLQLELEKLPIDLSLTKGFGKLNGEYLAKISLDSFNLQLVEPFVPIVKNVKGIANAKISINGTNEKDYILSGFAGTSNLTFKLLKNYLDYKVSTNLLFENQTIKIKNLDINNLGTNSSANVEGTLELADNTLNFMDLNLKANNFIVLDEYSKQVSPQFYGRVNVSTKNEGVKISGNPQNLIIDGDLQINQSNLTIANMNSSNVITKTNFEYVIKDNKRIYTIITQPDTVSQPKQTKVKVNRNSVPDINLSVYIPKSVTIKIDLGTIGEVVAILGTPDPTIPIKYIMGNKNPYGQLYGELIVKEGSTLNSYKTMATTGTISFNTGNLQEPNLNLTARYDGKIEDQTNPIKYSVFIYITGTPVLPKVRFDYTINNMTPQGEQKKIEENALYLLLFGSLPGGTSGVIDPTVVNKLGNAGISSIASRSMSDLLLRTGVIESADVELNSDDFEKTKIQLKGKLFGTMNWSFGGNVSDLTKSNQIIIEIPLSIDSKTFNQIVWLISYSTNSNSTIIDPDEKNWELKLKIGGSW